MFYSNYFILRDRINAVNSTEIAIILISARNLCNFHIRLGCSLNDVCLKISPNSLERIVNIFENCNYILILHTKSRTICILLKTNETADTVLSAYFAAVYYGLALSYYNRIPWVRSFFFPFFL